MGSYCCLPFPFPDSVPFLSSSLTSPRHDNINHRSVGRVPVGVGDNQQLDSKLRRLSFFFKRTGGCEELAHCRTGYLMVRSCWQYYRCMLITEISPFLLQIEILRVLQINLTNFLFLLSRM